MTFEANYPFFANCTQMCTSGSSVHGISSRELMSLGTSWEQSFHLEGIGQNLVFQVSTFRWCNKFTVPALSSSYILRDSANTYFYSLQLISTFILLHTSLYGLGCNYIQWLLEIKNVTSLTDKVDNYFLWDLFLSQILSLKKKKTFYISLMQHFHYILS